MAHPDGETMNIYRAGALAFASLFLFTPFSWAQNAEFAEALKKNRGAISVQDGKLAGPSAEILRGALADHHFVAGAQRGRSKTARGVRAKISGNDRVLQLAGRIRHAAEVRERSFAGAYDHLGIGSRIHGCNGLFSGQDSSNESRLGSKSRHRVATKRGERGACRRSEKRQPRRSIRDDPKTKKMET